MPFFPVIDEDSKGLHQLFRSAKWVFWMTLYFGLIIITPLEVSWLAPMCVIIEMQFVRQNLKMIISWSIFIQIAQTTPHFWTSFRAEAICDCPKLSIKNIFVDIVNFHYVRNNLASLWYTLLAMFSCSAVIQSIISYLTSKKKILRVIFILYDVKFFISYLFDVK